MLEPKPTIPRGRPKLESYPASWKNLQAFVKELKVCTQRESTKFQTAIKKSLSQLFALLIDIKDKNNLETYLTDVLKYNNPSKLRIKVKPPKKLSHSKGPVSRSERLSLGADTPLVNVLKVHLETLNIGRNKFFLEARRQLISNLIDKNYFSQRDFKNLLGVSTKSYDTVSKLRKKKMLRN